MRGIGLHRGSATKVIAVVDDWSGVSVSCMPAQNSVVITTASAAEELSRITALSLVEHPREVHRRNQPFYRGLKKYRKYCP